MIIAGHGRVEAGKKLDIKEVPCIVLSGLTEAQKKAYVIADNKMALNAGWNEELLKTELEKLKELDFDLELTGFNIELTNDNQYKFINVCDIHKEFILTHDQFHNRCSSTRYMYGVLCPICNPERNPQTSIETIMKDILDKLNIEYIQHDRKLIGPKELDFYLNNYKIAIERNGTYWHSLQKKDKNYHINKFNICRDKGIQLISFWEYDIKHNESFITNILKIYSNNIEHNYTDNFNYEIKCIGNKEYRDFINLYRQAF